MTDAAEELDLETAAEGVKSLYKNPTPKSLILKRWTKAFWIVCHSLQAGAC